MERKSYYLNHLILICCFSAFCLACGTSPTKQAELLLEKSIQAHGGQEAWGQVEKISFRKWTQLLNEDGSIESETDQLQEFRLSPRFEAKISWESDSLLHISSFDGQKMSYMIGDNEVKSPDFLASKRQDVDAAFYVLAQPWKLLEDSGAKLSYQGKKKLTDQREVEVIEVDYGPEEDTWWYYFDPNTSLMIGNEVQLNDHRSLIFNTEEDRSTPFILHGTRESFRVNEKGEKLYMRALYRYSDYNITLANQD